MNDAPTRLADTLRDASAGDLVLIVDDVPDNLALLHDALDESGCTVLVATGGEQALARAAQALPDVVLLDAVMPGLDGFEVARRLKAQPATAHIPIIFMTGLTDTEHLVAALEAGAVDYVTKPIKPREVLARMSVHLQGARAARQAARQAGQARSALDAFGYASLALRWPEGRLVWQTALARELMQRYFGTQAPETPPALRDWLRRHLPDAAARRIEPPPLLIAQGAGALSLRLHQQTARDGGGEGGEWLLILRESCAAADVETLRRSLGLTPREAEVLHWVVQGKTNRDIGDILGSSPATVKKHLERVYVKLGVETRTAAAGAAVRKIREILPGFER